MTGHLMSLTNATYLDNNKTFKHNSFSQYDTSKAQVHNFLMVRITLPHIMYTIYMWCRYRPVWHMLANVIFLWDRYRPTKGFQDYLTMPSARLIYTDIKRVVMEIIKTLVMGNFAKP